MIIENGIDLVPSSVRNKSGGGYLRSLNKFKIVSRDVIIKPHDESTLEESTNFFEIRGDAVIIKNHDMIETRAIDNITTYSHFYEGTADSSSITLSGNIIARENPDLHIDTGVYYACGTQYSFDWDEGVPGRSFKFVTTYQNDRITECAHLYIGDDINSKKRDRLITKSLESSNEYNRWPNFGPNGEFYGWMPYWDTSTYRTWTTMAIPQMPTYTNVNNYYGTNYNTYDVRIMMNNDMRTVGLLVYDPNASSIRFKENVSTPPDLSFLNKIDYIKFYNYKYDNTKTLHAGIIIEEIREVDENHIFDVAFNYEPYKDPVSGEDMMIWGSIKDTTTLTMLLIEHHRQEIIKNSTRLDVLEKSTSQIEILEKRISTLENTISDLTKRITTLKNNSI